MFSVHLNANYLFLVFLLKKCIFRQNCILIMYVKPYKAQATFSPLFAKGHGVNMCGFVSIHDFHNILPIVLKCGTDVKQIAICNFVSSRFCKVTMWGRNSTKCIKNTDLYIDQWSKMKKFGTLPSLTPYK